MCADGAHSKGWKALSNPFGVSLSGLLGSKAEDVLGSNFSLGHVIAPFAYISIDTELPFHSRPLSVFSIPIGCENVELTRTASRTRPSTVTASSPSLRVRCGNGPSRAPPPHRSPLRASSVPGWLMTISNPSRRSMLTPTPTPTRMVTAGHAAMIMVTGTGTATITALITPTPTPTPTATVTHTLTTPGPRRGRTMSRATLRAL